VPILSTPLHDKPIVYGSALANGLFLVLVIVHIIPAFIAPISAIAALVARKGGKLHVLSGKYFVRSMTMLAITGILIDVVRLGWHYRENHSKYVGDSMPSTIPARLSFLFAALAVLWVLRGVTPPRVFRPTPASRGQLLTMPALLLAFGAALSGLIILRFSPWNGSLTMITSFCVLIVVEARSRLKAEGRADGVARHRIGMTFLGAFSWWGALQGFGPAIGHAVKGPDMSTTPYVGDQPGPYANYFVFFLVGWVPILAIGAFLIRRYRLRAASAASSASAA
jgi:hypothetical protein